MRFNPAPGWPHPPHGWIPGPEWMPDPSWAPAPPGWNFWVPSEETSQSSPLKAVPLSEQSDEATVKQEASFGSSRADDLTAAPGFDGSDLEAELRQAREEVEMLRRELAAERTHGSDLRHQLTRAEVSAESVRTAAPSSSPASVQGVAASQEKSEAGSIAHEIELARRELIELNDAVMLQRVGIYEYHHPLENADSYKERLAEIRSRIKDSVREKTAILASDRFAYNNSLAQGRKMTSDLSKLMLRAYNAEADNCVRSLRAGSLAAAIKRLDTSVETIARLGVMMEMRVSPDYHNLRVEELELTSDYLFRVQEERERAREERERLREERKAERELAAERERLDKERAHYANTVAMLLQQGKRDEASKLRQRIVQIDDAIKQNDFRAANVRAGYVYVISNVGAFGSNVVKIGLTRRLEPLDRVRELGDASVPFPFDVHAIYFSDNAVQLENELHAAFANARVNHVNLRREFFFATPAQVRDVLATKVGNLLEFTEEPEATQYFQSHGNWPDLAPGPGGV